MKKINYFLLLSIFFVFFLSIDVNASEFTMNSYTSATKNGTKNRYLATEIYNTGTTNTYTFGTRYNGKISTIETYFSYPFEQNTTYRLTYNMNTEDFRNNFGAKYWWDCDQTMNATNQHVGTLTYVSYKKVQFTFKPTTNTTCIRVLIGSTNASSTAITGISNWRLDSITLYDPDYQSGSGSGQGSSTPTPTPAPTPTPNPDSTNQDIINSNNNNTQSIINNNNNNTQDIINSNNDNTNNIIENNNSNTSEIISNNDKNTSEITTSLDSLKSSIEGCNNLLTNSMFTHNYYDTTGVQAERIYLGTDLIAVNNALSYYIYNLPVNYARSYVSFFDSNKNYLGRTSSNFVSSYTLNSSTSWNSTNQWSSTSYIAITINMESLNDTIYLVEGTSKCQNKLDSLNSSINDVNDTMKDDSVPTIDIDIDTASDTPIIDLIYMPLNLISKILDSSDNTCQPYVLPFDFSGGNNTLTLPCINLRNYLGNDFYNILNAIISFYMVYNIALMCVTIYNDITTLRDGFTHLYYSNDPNVIGFGRGDE